MQSLGTEGPHTNSQVAPTAVPDPSPSILTAIPRDSNIPQLRNIPQSY